MSTVTEMNSMAKRHRSKYPAWQRRHEAVLHWLLENPWATQQQCAALLGYSPSHISRIVNAPEFQRRYREMMETERGAVMRRVFTRIGG